MKPVEIVPVEDSSEMSAFVDLPWEIYEGNENWVPPLKSRVRRLLDPSRHPFWKFSERILFLARRDSEVVGRIAGIVDHNANRFRNEKTGAWGFFECREDTRAAAALFGAVEAWARRKGMTHLRGPLNPSTNYETGLLIEGFQHPPAIMMPYNPPYYLDLVESCGFQKEKDLVALLIVNSDPVSDRLARLADRLRSKPYITIRPFSMKDARQEIRIITELYHDVWSENWGFVPITDGEAQEFYKIMRWIGDPELTVFIYFKNDPAGIAMILPDINPLLKRLNGNLGLQGLLRIMLRRNEIKGVRGMLFGLRKRYQRMGLPFLAFDHLRRAAWGKNYQYAEFGWIAEDNEAAHHLEREGGARAYKRYRVFLKPLENSQDP